MVQTELQVEDHKGDPIDQASANEMRFRALALGEASRKCQRETHPMFDGESCMSCGSEIEEGRLKLGKIRCVLCQAAIEKKQKQRS